MHSDLIVIGGGIVGLATAYRFLEEQPNLSVVVLEKEEAIALHQSGRNSGVLHSGIYYKPGSLKAINCREGKKAMEAFCEAEQLPYELCGKVIVALNKEEEFRLDKIYKRGQANGVSCEKIGPERLRELEPHAAGVAALHVPEAGIIDFSAVCHRMAERIVEKGGRVLNNARVNTLRQIGGEVVVATTAGDFSSGMAVNCAGLHCDRVAKLAGASPEARIIPFRGEYYELRPEAETLVNNLIYPTPDPTFPFLGVHFTRMMRGGVECGPNAVLAFAREGYEKTAVSPKDLLDSFGYSGFLKLTVKHWRMAADEMWRSLNKGAFVRALQRLVPEIKSDDLSPAPAGIRAQAVRRDGSLVDDFLIEETERIVHVLNAPSPAATAALNIGGEIVGRLVKKLN